jgi:hypothetical protein
MIALTPRIAEFAELAEFAEFTEFAVLTENQSQNQKKQSYFFGPRIREPPHHMDLPDLSSPSFL